MGLVMRDFDEAWDVVLSPFLACKLQIFYVLMEPASHLHASLLFGIIVKRFLVCEIVLYIDE